MTDFSLEARVRDLETVVDALGLERFALYAFSAGGPTGITYADRHPERVSQLRARRDQRRGRLAPARRARNDEGDGRGHEGPDRTSWESPLARATLAEFLAPEAGDVERRVLMHFLGVSCNGRELAAFFDALREADASAPARRIRVPTLVVAGDADATIPIAASRRLASLIPGARFEILDGAGHIDASMRDPRLLRIWSRRSWTRCGACSPQRLVSRRRRRRASPGSGRRARRRARGRSSFPSAARAACG